MRTRIDLVKAPKLACILASAAMLAVSPLYAQDDDLDVLDDEESESVESAESESAETQSDEAAAPEVESEAEPVAEEVDIQTIYTVQGKQRLVAGSFELAPQIAFSINDRFIVYSGLLLSGIYHLKENVAVELSGGGFMWWDDPFGATDTGPRLGGRDTEMTVEIRNKERLAPELVQLYRLTWFTTADLQWSPVYGKVAV